MKTPDILCIGSVLWDIIGRSNSEMRAGSDVPGHIRRIPGGVAMNIAMTLANYGLTPALLSSVGSDPGGDELTLEASRMGLITDHLFRTDSLPTDTYMAIEGANGLIAAIADAHSLEKAGAQILTPLADGTLGDENHPWKGLIALDGNLTRELLNEIAQSPLFAMSDLRVAPASPGKADRLLALVGHPSATLYVNLEEAGLLCDTQFKTAADGAVALVDRGVHRVLVTDGGNTAAEAIASTQETTLRTACPPKVTAQRVTGAGDTFMAAHIASEIQGLDPQSALERALNAAATYVSGETPQ